MYEILYYLNIINIEREIKAMLVYFTIISNDFLSNNQHLKYSRFFKTYKQSKQESAVTKLFSENVFLIINPLNF